MRRQHPLKILTNTTTNFWLLIIPLVRGLIAYQFDFYNWAKGAWFDILIVLFILLSAYLRWYSLWYDFKDNHFHLRKGVFFKSVTRIPYSSLTAVVGQRSFLARPFRAVKLSIDTNAGSIKDADVTITVYKKDYEQIFSLLEKEKVNTLRRTYTPSRFNLIAFSFIFSSTLSGVIFFSTLLIQASKIASKEIEQTVYVTVEKISDTLSLGLPPMAIGLSIIVCIGWLISFISNVLRYLSFEITRRGDRIIIKNGLLTKRKYLIDANKINYADLRQNVLSKIFFIMSVFVNCAGYGKAKNEIAVLLPITTKTEVYGSLEMVLPRLKLSKNKIKPKKVTFFRFIYPAVYWIIGMPIAAYILLKMFNSWESMIVFVAVMSMIPAVWLLIAKIISFFTSGINFKDNTFCLRYSSVYSFHTVLVHRDRVAKVMIMQNIFQKINKSCDLVVYTNSEFTKSHKVKSLSYHEVVEFLNKVGLSSLTEKN